MREADIFIFDKQKAPKRIVENIWKGGEKGGFFWWSFQICVKSNINLPFPEKKKKSKEK